MTLCKSRQRWLRRRALFLSTHRQFKEQRQKTLILMMPACSRSGAGRASRPGAKAAGRGERRAEPGRDSRLAWRAFWTAGMPRERALQETKTEFHHTEWAEPLESRTLPAAGAVPRFLQICNSWLHPPRPIKKPPRLFSAGGEPSHHLRHHGAAQRPARAQLLCGGSLPPPGHPPPASPPTLGHSSPSSSQTWLKLEN